MIHQPMIIAGAGIAGLAASLACAGADRESVILERVTSFDEIGAGLQLGPNAVCALRSLGAWDAVEPVTSQPPEIHVRDGVSGKMLKRVRLGGQFEQRFGAPYRVAHRADLHRALLSLTAANPSIVVRVGHEIGGFAQTADGVSVQTSAGSNVSGAALIGADGMHSAIRQVLFPKTVPVPTHHMLHRALADSLRATGDVDLECVNLWLCPGGHVVHYPVGRPRKFNVVAVTPDGSSPAIFSARLSGPLPSILNSISDWTPWPALHVPALPDWHDGRVILIGDAAHGTLPYLAQGTAMALEDAACLLVNLRSAQSPTACFSAITAQRKRRTERLHETTMQAAANYHHQGLLRVIRNAALRMLPENSFVQRLAWIYEYQ